MTEDLVERACSVVVRQRNDHKWELLAFEHPLAGLQLVKGRIERGETPAHAACRELQEESGLVATKAKFLLTTNDLPDTGAWHFFLCEVQGVLPDTWTFVALDDGGQSFRFFWHSLDTLLSSEWHPLYHHALEKFLPRLNVQLKKL